MTDDIWEVCIGGESQGAPYGERLMCRCCGALFARIPSGNIPPHSTADVMAMLARGDFDS